jgi:hypothetical protein
MGGNLYHHPVEMLFEGWSGSKRPNVDASGGTQDDETAREDGGHRARRLLTELGQPTQVRMAALVESDRSLRDAE